MITLTNQTSSSPSVAGHVAEIALDKAAIVCKLQQITDHYMLGAGAWPADREQLSSFFKMVRDLGLEEDVPDSRPGTTRSTPLGKELKLDLVMAFVGAWDTWEIPSVLLDRGYIKEDEAEELWESPLVEAERRLRGMVLQAYFEFCNGSKRLN